MVELQEITEKPFEVWKQTVPEVNMTPLDHLEADGVNIQCINSSEFVVGKQTNFNGPVTIINCANAYTEHPMNSECKDEKEKVEKEKIVIREKVLSKSATMKVQEMAKETGSEKGPEKRSKLSERLRLQMKKRPLLQNLTIPAAILIAFAVVVAVILTKISSDSEPEDISNNQTCFPIPLLSRKACIYSSFDFENCSTTEQTNGTGNSLQQHPLPFVLVGQSGGPSCYTQEECLEEFKRHKCDSKETKCNFLVTSEGHFYEDRGWNQTNSLTGPAAAKSLLICFLGNFSDFEYPTYPQIESVKAFIHFGVENGYVAKNYILVPEKTIDKEDNSVYNIIKKWKNFNEMPFTKIVENQTILTQPINKKRHIIYTKKDWGGEPATSFIEMKNPIPYVSISHTVTPLCYNLSKCAPQLRNMQSYHFSRDFSDISYNFLVDSGGNIYEGRGWDRRNARGGFINGRNLDVAFIGDFSKKIKPTEEQVDGVQFLIEFGVLNGKISEDYTLISANSTFNTLSPGRHVYEIIKKWPHFDPNPKQHISD